MNINLSILNVDSKDILCLKNILLRVDELSLWEYYAGTKIILKKPFRAIKYREDKDASFNVYPTETGKLKGKDFRGDFIGDVIDFIMFCEKVTFYQALQMINKDFNLNLYDKKNPSNVILNSKKIILTEPRKNEIEETILKFKPRSFPKEILNFFKNVGISNKTLLEYNVYVADVLYKNDKPIYYYNPNDPCIVYFFPKTGKLKAYFPFRKENRFISNCSNEKEIQGFDQIDLKNKSKTLVLTKAMKEVMFLHEYKINALALHGEGHYLPLWVQKWVKDNFDKVIILYDNDKAGILNARKLFKEYGYKPYFINRRKYKVGKDLTDLNENYGQNTAFNFLKEIGLII